MAQRYPLHVYSVGEGLAQSGVTDIIQDHRGNLWVSTLGGISRFDGVRFVNYIKTDGFPAEESYDLIQDSQGIIWIGTNRGLVRFDGSRFEIVSPEVTTGESIGKLFEDKSGRLWIAHLKGLHVSTDEGFEQPAFFEGMPRPVSVGQSPQGTMWFATKDELYRLQGEELIAMGIPDHLDILIHDLLVDRRGLVWLATAGGLVRFDPKTGLPDLVTRDLPPETLHATDLIEDKRGNLWLSTLTGLLFYDRRNFKYYSKEQGLPPTIMAAVFEDREGNIWLGTGGSGIVKFNDMFAVHDTATGLNGDLVLTFIRDNRDRVWYGTMGGICVENGSEFECTEFTGMGNVVRDSGMDASGRLYFGTRHGVVVFDGNDYEGLTLRESNDVLGVEAVHIDSQQRVWLGTTRGLGMLVNGKLYKPDYLKPLEKIHIWTVSEDSRGHLWIGTNVGLYVLNGENLIHHPALRDLIIASVIEDQKGDIWLGIFGGGVARLSGDVLVDSDPEIFCERDGMSNDFVYSLIFDDHGFLWVGTNKGINRIDVRRFRASGEKFVKRYGLGEGFSGIECNRNAVYKDDDGSLWFGTVKGALRYHPDRDRPNTMEPITSVTSLRLFYEAVDWQDRGFQVEGEMPSDLILPYDENHLTFSFAGVSLSNPEKVRYRYQLDGFLNSWSPVTESRTATYSNLPPGDYTFRVKASNNDNVWNTEPTIYQFVIEPPIWMTWWFRSGVAIGLLAIMIVFLVFYQRRIARRAEEDIDERLNQQQQQKLEALGQLAGGIAHDFNNMLASMLGFNALAKLEVDENSLTFQHLNEVERSGHRAKDLIKQILTFSRQGKPEFRPVFIVDAVRDALKMAKISFPSGISLKQRLNPEAGWVMGDPTQIQQVLLNLCANARQAILGERGLVSVEVTVRSDVAVPDNLPKEQVYVVVSVQDTGIGMDSETRGRIFEPFFTTRRDGGGSGMGLAVIHGIVAAMNGAIQVESQPGKGSLFEVWLPQTDCPVTTDETGHRAMVRGQGQNILFVDDQEDQAKAHVQMLEHLGYHATGMTSAKRALVRFKQDPDAYDLIITDLQMPEMCGDAFAREVWRFRPGKPILLLTGLVSNYTIEDALCEGFAGFLVKPFTLAELGETIAGVLEKQPTGIVS